MYVYSLAWEQGVYDPFFDYSVLLWAGAAAFKTLIAKLDQDGDVPYMLLKWRDGVTQVRGSSRREGVMTRMVMMCMIIMITTNKQSGDPAARDPTAHPTIPPTAPAIPADLADGWYLVACVAWAWQLYSVIVNVPNSMMILELIGEGPVSSQRTPVEWDQPRHQFTTGYPPKPGLTALAVSRSLGLPCRVVSVLAVLSDPSCTPSDLMLHTGDVAGS
jgi:hypothetical protein